MDRRKSLKIIGLSTLSASVLLDACKAKRGEGPKAAVGPNKDNAHRQQLEVDRDEKLKEQTFFTKHEMETITVLSDIIIPKDDRSGSASDAEVPAFIEFMAKDRPENQVPLRGGLRWLDMHCLKQYTKPFKDCTQKQQLEMVDQIAYPATAKPEMHQGVAFFDRLRGLVAIGFFTSKMGIEDLGYVGNRPNIWKGVPDEIIKQYGLENVSFDMFRTMKNA
ncbi:MAG: gluconate 2-dehydrogenase subunit 3 family protein [Bacteroidota bacterium]|nr:gluconate 2-dehydrogenase subunit 3 family protein [Bacteroidota bacterium]